MDAITTDLIHKEQLTDLLRDVHCYTIERVEELVWHPAGKWPLGMIQEPTPLPEDTPVAVAIGLRGYNQAWLNPSADHIRTIESMPDGEVVVGSDAGAARNIWMLDRNGSIVEYQLLDPSGRLSVDVKCGKFKLLEGLNLPTEILELIYASRSDHSRYIRKTVKCDVAHYDLSEANNGTSDYTIVFPKGSQVLDKRTHQTFVIASGDRTLPDSWIFQALAKSTEQGHARMASPARARGRSHVSNTAPLSISSGVPYFWIGLAAICVGLLVLFSFTVVRWWRDPPATHPRN